MIQFIKVKNKDEGQEKAHDFLKKLVDKNTLLALSGGTSVDYRRMIVDSGDLSIGAVCMVDERFRVLKQESNEFLMEKSDLIDYLEKHEIAFNKILHGKSFLETAKDYEKTIEGLFKKFPKKVGVMGVGTNLHTAGIFPETVAARSPNYVEAEIVEDKFSKRITLTLKALGEFTTFIIMMFGPAKRDALKILLSDNVNDMQKYPAIFYRKAPVKSFLITDINS